MAFKIYNYENTLKFHRSALLNAVEKVNKKLKNFQDVLIIISTKNMIKTLPISIITGRKTVIYLTGFGRLYTDYGFIGRWAFGTIIKLYNKASAIGFIVEHQKDKTELEKFVNTEVFSTHGSGLDPKKLKLNRVNRNKKIRYGYLSRFGESKGSDKILKFARKLPSDSELYIAGWDIKNLKYSVSFREVAKQKNNIFFLGKLNNRTLVSDFFNNIDCFLAPSKREGGCISIQEAIWHRVPFITTNVPGCDLLAKAFGCPAFNLHSFTEDALRSGPDTIKIDTSDWQKKLKPFLTNSVSNEFHKILTNIALNTRT